MKKKIQKYLSGEREGFSLIELIIVIAIMAILIGVIALVVLPYLESARENRDRQTLSEVSNAFKSAMADETTAKSVQSSISSYTKINGAAAGSKAKELADKMEKYMDGTIADAADGLASDACKGGDICVKASKDADGKWTMSACIQKSGSIVEDSDGTKYEQ